MDNRPIDTDPRDAEALDRVLTTIRSGRKPAMDEEARLCRRARTLLAERRHRSVHFADLDHLSGDARWEMLLFLFSVSDEPGLVSVTEIIRQARCAATTGLRYVDSLEQNGLVTREQDRHDKRKSNVAFTLRGDALMRSYLADIDQQRSSSGIGL